MTGGFVLLASAWWLAEQGHVPNQVELAGHAGIDVKMASQVIRRLEGKGLLRRGGGRIRHEGQAIDAYRGGAGLASRAIDAVETVDAQFFGGEADNITAILRRLAGRAPRGSALYGQAH